MKHSKFLIYFFLMASCVEPYILSTSDYKEAILVEGMITDQPGPYEVKISKALPINSNGGIVLVSGATVTIQDDQGNSEILKEGSSGSYYTNTFQGIVGRSYSISIATQEGSTYKSIPEKLLPVGDFTNLRYEFVQKEPPLTNGQITSKNGFNFFIDSQVLPEQEGRVWWRWTGTFEIFTYPQLKVRQESGPNGAFVILPDPPRCSGYLVGNKYGEGGGPKVLAGPFWACTCCTCWVTQHNQVPLLSDPNFVSNGEINNQYMGFVEANVRTMYNKYYIEVQQLSVSQQIYDFWKKVKAQESNSSNLFQTPPAKTGGNIVATSSGAVPVIGYFAASSIKKHSISIDQTAVPYKILQIDTIKLNCTEAYKISTATKPVFW